MLGECRTRASLRRALAALPPTLDKTYDRILSKISDLDAQYAVPILRWLTFSARPLSVGELAEIVAINLEDEARFDRDEVLEDPLDALSICSSLVTMTVTKDAEDREPGRSRRIVTLAHYSVKEYLVSDRIEKGLAARYSMQAAVCHDAIARSCLGYLLQFQGDEIISQDNAKEFKLADYSARFWIEHAQATKQHVEYVQEAMILLSTENDAYLNWLRIHDPDHDWREPDFQKSLQSYSSPLYYTSLAGLLSMVKLLLDKGAEINAQGTGTHSRTALHLAAWGGHIDTFHYLANLGFDLSALDAKGDGVLCYASSGGSLDVLQAALNHGLTLSSENMHWSALHWACRSGKPEVVELLIKEGLRGESVAISQPQGRWSPLDIAIFHGHKEMLEKVSSSCRDLLGSESDTTPSPGKWYGGYLCNGCFHVSVEPELLSLFDMKAGHLWASISLLHLPGSKLLFHVQAILR